jgi:DNA-binding NtrC family response regulator
MSSDAAGETIQAKNRPQMLVRRFRVVVVEGVDQGATATSDGEPVVVGKAEGATLVLRDPLVSRMHAELVPSAEGVTLRDLGSKNGIFLGSLRVKEAVLNEPTTLQLGESTLLVDVTPGSAGLALSLRDRFGGLVGRSDAMRRVFYLLEKAASLRVPVLLQGERGTGKQAAARALHEASPWAGGPFVVVDCAGVPGSTMESELFGHTAGAFSSATSARQGALALASGGTLFLDEVGELPPELQLRLLQAIEGHAFRPLGAAEDEPLTARIVAATHLDLPARVNARQFRADLYHRLAIVVVSLPSLRARPEDLALLIDALLLRVVDETGMIARPEQRLALIAEAAQRRFTGNIHELHRYLEQSLALGSQALFDALTPAPEEPELPVDSTRPLKLERERWNDRFERRYLALLLEQHAWNVSAAARAACIERESLHRLLRYHQIQRPR